MEIDMNTHLFVWGWDSNRCALDGLWSDGQEMWRHPVACSQFDTMRVFEPIPTYCQVDPDVQNYSENGGILCPDVSDNVILY